MPTIREQFEQAKADFAAAFKAGDAERAREAGELAEKYEAIVKMADEKGAKLNAGAPVRHSGARGTLGEWALTGSWHMAVQDFRIGIPGMLLQILHGRLQGRHRPGHRARGSRRLQHIPRPDRGPGAATPPPGARPLRLRIP